MALIAWSPKQAMADYYIAWTDIIDNGNHDYARGVAIDGFNNIIVTGYSKIGGNYDIYTVKYDPNGNILWADTIDAGNPGLAYTCCSVATDGSDNIIVTGVSNDSYYFTVKYDPDGNILWSDIDTGSGGYMYMCCGVTTDGADNIIVTRGLYYPTYSDYCVVKHDPDGNVLWTDTIDIGTWDYAYGITTDGSDNIIVTGYSLIGGSWHDCTVKYDADGNRLWTNIGNGREAHGVATDSANNIIVTGYVRPGGQNDYYTVKYDPDGNVLWEDIFNNSTDDVSNGVATDNWDNIFVTGASYNDYLTIKYDPDGNILWTASIDNGDYDSAQGVATDDANNVIVTGCSKIGWNYDYYTVKYVPVMVGFDISGNIGYFSDDAPVPNADVELTEVDYTATTDEFGEYLFEDIPGGNYVSTPLKDDDIGGLSGTDASRIARYAAGLYSLNCLEMIAGDVSMNGEISGLDASRVARYIAGLITELNSNDINWVFTPETIPDCADWPPIVYESTREYSPLNSDLTDEDFIGIRLGDVSGNWSPGVREPIIYDPYEITDIETDINSTLRIPIVTEVAKAIEGIDVGIEFNPEVLKLIELSLNEGILDNKNYGVETNIEKAGEGIIVMYAQKDLVSESGIVAFIDFEVIGEVGSKSEVYFNKFDVNETEASGGLQVVGSEGNEIVTRRLEVNVVQSLPDKFALYQNYPNPLNPQTTIFYTLPKSTKVSLSIYNIKGQLVETLVNDFQQPGYYSVVWESKNVGPGVYLYRITAGEFRNTRRCVILK